MNLVDTLIVISLTLISVFVLILIVIPKMFKGKSLKLSSPKTNDVVVVTGVRFLKSLSLSLSLSLCLSVYLSLSLSLTDGKGSWEFLTSAVVG